MENSPTIALLTIYESDIFNTDSPSGYDNESLTKIIDELKRLGFDVVNINPLLNKEIKYIIESTIRHEKRVNLISSVLVGNFDYFLYVNVRNQYITVSKSEDYRIEIVARIRLLNNNLITNDKETVLDESILYDTYDIKSEVIKSMNMTRTDLKARSLITFIDFLINFLNKYVRDIRNYEYALDGEEPICFDFNYDTAHI
jgi:hypothetical protein